MNLPFLRRKDENLLPQATAEQLLSNVFMVCSREPNSVPLEALTAYSNYRKERYALQRSVIIAMLILFLLLPLLFFAAGVTVMLTNPGSNENPIYAVSVNTQIPIRQIEARLGDQTVPLYESAPGEYTAAPLDNGKMRIAVTLVNHQSTVLDIEITDVDHDAPRLVSTQITADGILFQLADEGSGIHFAGITITAPDGKVSSPLRHDPQTNCVTLPYPQEALNVLIPDNRGNVLEVNLKPQT